MVVDILNENRLTSLAADYDLVVNVAAPEWEVLVPALRAAIAAGTDYCDIGAVGFTTEQQLELNSAAKERGVVAVVGVGFDPGVSNLLAVHASRKFDRLEEIEVNYVFNVQADLRRGKTERTGLDMALQFTLYLASMPARVYRDGRWVDIDARENPIEMAVPDVGTVTGYPVGMPEPFTLPRYLPGVKKVTSVLSFFPPPLNELRFGEGRRIGREGIAPREATQSFLAAVAANPDRWLKAEGKSLDVWKMWVEASGWKEDRRARYTCWPLGPLASTTIPLRIGALRILRGEVPATGVLPPEGAFEPTAFFEEAARIGREQGWDKPFLEERFEWLD